MTQTTNPLAAYFRKPALSLKLPSLGKYWSEGSINLSVTGELSVYPLTAKDEIILKTPDALSNGLGVVHIIQSCIPNILNAWKMPAIDIDAVLIAIRVASYGNSMSIYTSCPKCEEEQKFQIDLNNILKNIPGSLFDEVFTIGDLRVKFSPSIYFEMNKINSIESEENKINDIISNNELSIDEKETQYTQCLSNQIDLNLFTLSESTEYIQVKTGEKVYQKEFITEFYKLSARDNVVMIQQAYDSLVQRSKLQPITCACNDCKQEFKVALQFDYSNFFT